MKLEGSTDLSEQFDVILFRRALHRALHFKTVLSQVKKWLCVGGCLLVAERYPDWRHLYLGLIPNVGMKQMIRKGLTFKLSPQAWMKSLRMKVLKR